MDKKFTPSNFEKRIYNNWLEKKYFKAEVNKNKKPFTIVMPPPNITSRLHIGHSYGIAIMDAITRYKRMQGFEALLLPGTDHAAIATEAKVVERLASQGITKQQLGREGFIKKMHEWYDEFGTAIVEQFKLVGISCDWDKYAFTLDEKRSEAVKHAFVKLYKKGLIYQGNRITNWCVNCKTALSDIEVEYEENDGAIWHINYKLQESDNFITVATTRPETILGDVAVAVNPKDKRYKNLVGKNVILPIINKPIPIIADDYVDIEFGTGIVKITPAHDPNDYEIGLRHNLEPINIMHDNGIMNSSAGKYEGLDRFECRKEIVKDLSALGQLPKIEKYKNKVGHCQRCNAIVEPMISKQWYVKMKELAEPAIEVVKTKEIKFLPQRFEKIYFNWMNNIKDWCISRQIWSGHRIPVHYCKDCNQTIVEYEEVTSCTNCGSKNIYQDLDSLDTWFSSAFWPFTTLGWPNETEELNYFYPTDLMVTAYDIIFFWVARMIFSGLEYTGKIPFKDVLMHGLIRDSQGRKMSKSLGNGIDPIEIIDKYGADTLRFALLQGVGIGQDSRFSYDKADSVSNFINKLWNASRFVIDNANKLNFKKLEFSKINLNLADKWILNELNEIIKVTTKAYDKYDLGLVITQMYDFVWNKFCDWYIEASKVKLYEGNETEKLEVMNVLVYVLEAILKILHPIIPFVTEEIYLHLPNAKESIMIQPYPVSFVGSEYKADAKTFNSIMQAIKSLRNLRSEMNISDNVKTNLFVLPLNKKSAVNSMLAVIKKLAMAQEIELITNESMLQEKNVFVVNELLKLIIPTSMLIDPEKELLRLNNELSAIEAELTRAKGMLNNEGFVSRAPANLIEAEKEKIIKYTELKETVINSINNLK